MKRAKAMNNRTAAIAMFALILLLSRVGLATEGVQPGFATPSLETTDAEVSADNIVPSDIKTLDDYRLPFAEGEVSGGVKVSLWRVLGSLAIIVVMIVVVIYVLKFFYSKGMRYDLRGKHIRVLDVVSLGTNRNLHLIAVGRKIILIGSGDKGFTYLTEMSEKEDVSEVLGEWREEGSVGFEGELETAIQNVEPPSAVDSRGEEPAGFAEKIKEKLNKLEDDKQRE